MKKAYGIMPPMITIWNDDETFNEKATINHLNWLIDEGITSVSVCGSTGENISMDPEETKRLIKILVEAVDGRIPVYPATGAYSTKTTIELSQYAEKVGGDGLLIIPPYYMNPHKDAVLDHYRAIKKNVGIPIMLYDNPFFAGYKMTIREITQLANEGIIDSIKCAQGDVADIHDLQYLCGDKLDVFYGHDYSGIEALLMGAHGWLTGSLNVLPRLGRQIYDAITVDKDPEKAKKIWYQKYMPFIDFIMREKENGRPHWLEVFKAALTIMGHEVGEPRKPMGKLTPEMNKKLEKVLEVVLG
jgi:4-hydroxy-tetrahydrodipicolinate synthase